MSNNEYHQNLYKKLQTIPKIRTIDDGLRYVQRESHVLILDGAAAIMKAKEECDKFIVTDEEIYPNMVGFVLPENSPYLQTFNRA